MEKTANYYKQIIEQIPGYFFVKDRDSRFLACNKNFADFAGETTESIVGKSEHEMIWKDEAEHFIHDDREVMRTGIGKANYKEPKKGYTILTNKFPYRDENGNIIGVIGTFIILDE